MRRSSLRQHAKPPSTPFFWPYMYKQRYTERRPKCREWCNILEEHRDSRKGVGEKGMDSFLLRLPLSSFITARRIRTECVTVPSPPGHAILQLLCLVSAIKQEDGQSAATRLRPPAPKEKKRSWWQLYRRLQEGRRKTKLRRSSSCVRI